MALLRNSQLLRGAQRCLVLWQGLHVADTWLLLDELAHCPEKVAEYDAAAHSVPQHRQRRRLRAVATGAGTCDPDVRLMVPTGFRIAASWRERPSSPSRREGGTLPMASRGLGPRSRDPSQQDRRNRI